MDTKDTALPTLQRAVALCNDSQAELARRCTDHSSKEYKPQEVWNWLHRDMKAPVDACPFIEAACGYHPEVTCELLRPDYQGWELVRAKAQGAVVEPARADRRRNDAAKSAT